jgi:hypothetical protein
MAQENSVASAPRTTWQAPADERISQEQPLSVTPKSSLASILVPCCGQLEYTKLCLPSLLKNTRPPYELIFLEELGDIQGCFSA